VRRSARATITTILIIGFLSTCIDGCGSVDPGQEIDSAGLDFNVFQGTIQPILDLRGCSQGGCHYRDKSDPYSGGPGGSFQIYNCMNDPCTDDQFHANYDSASGLSNPEDPSNSKLLLKPLAESAGGIQHLGGDIFVTTSDPDYLAILSWIQTPS
jgi:hypothetical protein